MTAGRVLDSATLYPNFVARMPTWRTILASAPRVQRRQRWARELPASYLKRDTLDPPELLAPIGYRYTHNRFNGLHCFPAFYLADGQSTAFAEVFGGAAVRAGQVGPPDYSRLTLPVDACLMKLVDLRDAGLLFALGITEDALTEEKDALRVDHLGRFVGYELPQCLGEIGNAIGLTGYLYASAEARKAGHNGENIVIFTDNLAATSSWYQGVDPVTERVERWPRP